MKIMIKLGNLLEANEHFIVHQINCKAKMKSGVAKQIRDKYPQHYIDYMDMFEITNNPQNLLGKIIKTEVDNHTIIGMFSQFNYGYNGERYTNYEAFYTCLETLFNHVNNSNIKSIAFPYKIGCDRGGGNWSIIETMIKSVFDNSDITITFYKYNG